MLRYLAFAWNRADRQQSQAVQQLVSRLRRTLREWQAAGDHQGLTVLVASASPRGLAVRQLADGAGVVVGTLFGALDAAGGCAAAASLDAAASRSIIRSRGRHLVDHYWGRYVAFLHDPRAGETRVLRDPAGGMPCFRTTFRDVTICFSYMQDCLALGLPGFTVDWRYIARHAYYEMLHGRQTALHEISEVMPGECVTIAAGRVSTALYWDAAAFARSGLEESAAVAAARLRSVTRACVEAWASGYGRVIHKLSGGLDSAIVLACLQDAPHRPHVVCLNDFSAGSDSDERAFARLAAARARVRLIERRRNPEVRLERMLGMAKSPIPTVCQGCAQGGPSDGDVAREVAAEALFGGRGGDQLLYSSGARLTVADYVRAHGIRLEVFGMAMDAARIESTHHAASVWSVLRWALQHELLRRPFDPLTETYRHRTLVSREVVALCEREAGAARPRSRTEGGLPPGKAWQVHQLAFPEPLYDLSGSAQDPEPVQPLRSQPLIELCLRIPTWLLMQGGRERGLARSAFAAEVPREILLRRAKGGMSGHLAEVLRGNLGFARELLLDGLLAQAGLLDPRRLEAALCGDPAGVVTPVEEILNHLNTEAWLRGWAAAPQREAR